MMDASEKALAELSENIKIDQDDMDGEIISQPNDFYHASTGYAMAVSLRDKAKNDLEIAEAELYKMFRDEVSARGDRATEKLLEAMINSNEVRQEQFDKYLEAKLLADKWLALRDSFTQKGYALRELAELHKVNYFGDRTATVADRTEAEARVRSRATENDH